MMTINREGRSQCMCGRPAMVVSGKLEWGALGTNFTVGICLKSGAAISVCQLAPPSTTELAEMKKLMEGLPF